MSFYLFFLSGIAGGVLGGMGMGGGTLLIPLLTLVFGLPQGVAQGVNLLSFLPMSLLALSVHAGNGLLEKEGLWQLILPALLFSALGAVCAVFLPANLLRKGFGLFLLLLSAFPFSAALRGEENKRKKVDKNGKNFQKGYGQTPLPVLK